ncbi:hxnY [Symbiodinium natans]|uniref:HxnY protein n=1 Tax=Symbiodinium natans TaxID=878477 RepID=A0A812IG08_9DINO|nr:hxnY [Symbiodinium natans]
MLLPVLNACLLFQLSWAKHAEIEQVSITAFRRGNQAEREAQVSALRRAFAHHGMVALVETEVPEEVVARATAKSREFFALPQETKARFAKPAGYPPRSYGVVTTPRGKCYEVQQDDGRGNLLNEWLYVRNTTVAMDVKDAYYSSDEGREFYNPEAKHPEQQLWPEEVPGLQEATAAFYHEVEELSKTMYELFARALGLAPDFFLQRARRAPIWPVTIAHYPPQEKEPEGNRSRIQPHWDRTLFSLITTSDSGDEESEGGLQILVDSETGEGVDGRAQVEGRDVEWQQVVRPKNGFVVNVGEMMSRWSNGRMKHVVHRVPNPVPGREPHGRISLMAFVLPDYDAVVECIHCSKDGSEPLYEKTWVGEMMNWGSKLPIYNQTKMEAMRRAQGLYTNLGAQTKLGEPTDVKAMEAMMAKEVKLAEAKAIRVVDVAPLVNGSFEEQLRTAKELSAAFETTGFAVITGHGVPKDVVDAVRTGGYNFFRQEVEEKKRFDKGKGYGFGGYVSMQENGAQLLGDFSRPNDAVESLTAGLAGLAGGVEAVQMEKVRKEDSGSTGVCHAKDLSGCEMEEGTPEVVARPATTFLRAVEKVARLAAKALQLSLGATDEELDLVMTPSAGGLRLAYYPSVTEAATDDLMGYGSHIDSGGVTVIALDPANKRGLQVDVSDRVGSTGREEDRHWVDVPFVPNTFVLNVGALLSRWTGGRWKASVHRVLANRQSHERLSIITGALSPKIDAPPFAGFAATNPSLPPVPAREFLTTRVDLHRPEYREERGLNSPEALAAESARIRELQI